MPDRECLKILAGDAHPDLGAELADELGAELLPVELSAFADGETRVKIDASVRDATVLVVQPTCPPVNENLMKLALLVDAVRASGAAWVGAVVSYFGYARQERRTGEGEPRSAQLAARLLGLAGVDHLITLDLHSPALESALPMPVTHLSPDRLFLPLLEHWGLESLTVVSPDAGALDRAQRYALTLDAELAAIAKVRSRPDAPKPLQPLGDVRDRVCLLVDDIASTGRTLVEAAETLLEGGARTVHAAFTHPVMAEGALQRLTQSSIERMVTSNSIPPPSHAKTEVVPLTGLLAETIRGL